MSTRNKSFSFLTRHLYRTCSLVTWTYFTFSVTIFILSSSSIPRKINFIFFLGARMQGGDEDYYLLLPGNASPSGCISLASSTPDATWEQREIQRFCCFEHQYRYKVFVRVHNTELVLTQQWAGIFIRITNGSGGKLNPPNQSSETNIFADRVDYSGIFPKPLINQSKSHEYWMTQIIDPFIPTALKKWIQYRTYNVYKSHFTLILIFCCQFQVLQ